MSLTTYQRHLRAGQPRTRISPEIRYEEIEVTVDGKTSKGLIPNRGFAVYGYTLEFQLKPNPEDKNDPEWEQIWEEHDLGQESDLGEAHIKAHEWRESLRDVYPIS